MCGQNIAIYTMPGEYARQLPQIMTPGASYALPVKCWAVVNDEVRAVEVFRVRGARVEWHGADYADCKDGSRVGTFYLWPKSRHAKPELRMIEDEYGKTRQWVARLTAKTPW